MATETKDTFNNLFKQASRSFETLFNSGTKLQEEAFRMFSQPFTGCETLEDVCRRGEQFTTDLIGTIQRNMAESFKAADAQCKNSVDLVRKTFEVADRRGDADVRDRAVSFWQATFDAFRTANEISTKTGMQTIENWSSFWTTAFNLPSKSAAAK